jgi:hypothetical protein
MIIIIKKKFNKTTVVFRRAKHENGIIECSSINYLQAPTISAQCTHVITLEPLTLIHQNHYDFEFKPQS